MFCCGGGRKSRTRADLIGALSDFNDVRGGGGAGLFRTEDPRLRSTEVQDQGSDNGPNDDQPSAGDGDIVQIQPRFTNPNGIRAGSGATDDNLASQGLAWAYRPDPRYDGSELGTESSIRPEWIEGISKEHSRRQPSIGSGHTQAEGDCSRSPIWRYQESVGMPTPDNGGSQYPGWIVQGSLAPTEQNSRRRILKTKISFQSDQSHQPEWLGNEPQTARSDFSQRPGWIEIGRSPSKTAESERRKDARAEHRRRERYSNLVSNNGPIIVDSEYSTDYSPHRRRGTNRKVHDDGGKAGGPGPTNGNTPEPTHDRLYRKAKGTWSPAPRARGDDGSNSPKTMRGGESSSEVALRPPSEVADIPGERAKNSNQDIFSLSDTTCPTSEESVANFNYHRMGLKEADASKALRVENRKSIGVSRKGRRDQHHGTSGRQSPRQPTGEEPAPVPIRSSVHPSPTSKAMLDYMESKEEGRRRRKPLYASDPSPVKLRVQDGASSTAGMDPASSLPPPTRRKKEQLLSPKGSSEGEKSPGTGATPPGDAGSYEQRNLRNGRSGARSRQNPQVHDHVRAIVFAAPAKFIPGQTPPTFSTGMGGNEIGQSERQSPRQIGRGLGIHRSGQSNKPRGIHPTPSQRSDQRPSSRGVPYSSGIAPINSTHYEEAKVVDKRGTQPGPSEPDQLAIAPSQSEGMGPGSRGPVQPLKDDGSSKRSRNRQGHMRGTPPQRNPPRSTSGGRRLPPLFEEPSTPGRGRSREVDIPSVKNTPANDPHQEDSPTTGWPHPLPLRPSLDRDDSNHSRRMRISRSSSMEEGSISSFQSRAMFSPDRFNAGAGVIWGGSMDDSWCAGSESAISAITRGSSSQSVSSRTAEQERPKFVRPQLSIHDRESIDRLKINQADLYFGYRPVRGSTKVYKVGLNGEMRAAKVISILHLSKEAKEIAMEAFYSELLQLRELESPNIVKVYGASVSAADIILVSEFIEGGMLLRDLLENQSRRNKPNMRTRLCIAQDVAAGMKTLHMNGVQHCQLTSLCILLTQDWRAKIAGAGLLMTRELVGYATDEEYASDSSLLWKAREVLAGAAFSDRSDVYSFGIVLWEIMQEDGSLPYAGLLPGEVMRLKYIGEGLPIPSSCSPTLGKLVQSCWSILPTDRPSFEQIVDVLDSAVASQRTMDGIPARV